MNRKEFLSLLGLGAAGIVIPACIGGCSKDSSVTAATNVDESLDLTSTTYSMLKTKGQFAYIGSLGIVVAYGTDGNYYAVQSICPHESKTLRYDSTTNKINCNNHTDQFFSLGGISEGQRTNSNLKTYTCTLVNNNTLRVQG